MAVGQTRTWVPIDSFPYMVETRRPTATQCTPPPPPNHSYFSDSTITGTASCYFNSHLKNLSEQPTILSLFAIHSLIFSVAWIFHNHSPHLASGTWRHSGVSSSRWDAKQESVVPIDCVQQLGNNRCSAPVRQPLLDHIPPHRQT